MNPTREFDTRSGLGGFSAQRLAAGTHLEFTVAGKNGVPTTGAGTVVLNVTATNSAGGGFVTVYPCGDRPLTSNLNLSPPLTVPNTVIAPVSSAGTVCLYTSTDTDLVADVSGWFAGPTI